ncbi:MAG TPA: DHA2 family efflux MFS transporter permease subunit, partial [Thermoanaerobaculia bacterium]
ATGAPDPDPPITREQLAITGSILTALSLAALDSSVVGTAMPTIIGQLGGLNEYSWVFSGYLLASTTTVPLFSKLADTYGRRPIFLFGLIVFVVSSIACGFVTSMLQLVIFRTIQGLGAGALQPTEQAILRQTFPPKEQGMAMAVFGMAVVLGPAFGPTLGGYIVDNYSWPWIFYINIPIGAISLLMVSRFVHEPEDVRATMHSMAERQRKHLDWAGIGLLIVGVGTMQYVLEEGNRNDWFASGEIKTILFISIVVLLLLVIRELSATVPAVDFSLFKDMVFMSGTMIGAVMFAMLMSVTFLLPIFMQTLLGFSAMQSGLALMPRSLTMLVVMPIVGRLYNKVSPRIVIAFGILLFAYTAWLMGHYTLATSNRDIMLVLVLQGVAFACLFIPLTTVALSTIPRHRMPDATGLNSLLRQIGGSIGLAVMATLMTRFATRARDAMLPNVTLSRPVVMSRLAGISAMLQSKGYDAVAARSTAVRMLDGQLRQQAMMLSFERLFYTCGIAFLCVLPLVFLLRSPHHGPSEKVDVHIEL